jgi:hypothetical protein
MSGLLLRGARPWGRRHAPVRELVLVDGEIVARARRVG